MLSFAARLLSALLFLVFVGAFLVLEVVFLMQHGFSPLTVLVGLALITFGLWVRVAPRRGALNGLFTVVCLVAALAWIYFHL
ncbi:MAG TPA: hypothetical protein VKX46_09565 [Ktedonobacteraceae bacterium]|nr:hypothetical protein [Ktedonobacteraceae bacterium]